MLWFNLYIVVAILSVNILASDGFKKPKPRKPSKRRFTTISTTNISDIPTTVTTTPEEVITSITEFNITTTTEHITSTSEEPATSTTTEKITTTGPPIPTTCDDSLYTREDLKEIIASIVHDKQVSAKIEEVYHSGAVDIKDKYLQDLETFKKAFQARPLDLLPIINGMEEFREKVLQPLVSKSVADSEYFEKLENKIYTVQKKYEPLKHDFSKQKKICELACNDDILENRLDETSWHLKHVHATLMETATYDPELYFCGKFSDVRDKINMGLDTLMKKAQIYFENALINNNTSFGQQISEIKNKLKIMAYNDFQKTVYRILAIQKDYGVINVTIEGKDFENIINNINSNIALFELKLVTFQIKVRHMARHCQKCSGGIVPRNLLNDDSQSQDLLNEVLNIELQNLLNNHADDYAAIYSDLLEAIQAAESGSYLDVYKDIHARVDAAIKDELMQLETLQQNVTVIENNFVRFVNARAFITGLLSNVEENMNYIDHLLNTYL